MATKDTIAKAPAGRVRRTPLNGRNVLTVSGKEPGYEYRIVNDNGGRVQAFLDNGWETVEMKDVRIGDKRLGAPTSAEGTVATAAVGQGMQAYVLRIRKEWYDEDQQAKQEQINQIEAATKEKALDGNYGELKITRS